MIKTLAALVVLAAAPVAALDWSADPVSQSAAALAEVQAPAAVAGTAVDAQKPASEPKMERWDRIMLAIESGQPISLEDRDWAVDHASWFLRKTHFFRELRREARAVAKKERLPWWWRRETVRVTAYAFQVDLYKTIMGAKLLPKG